MSVAAHLAVTPAAYDRKIRALIPFYGESLLEASAALNYAQRPVKLLVDLGIGTGALTRACLRVAPRARVIGIDEDDAMAGVARRRLASITRNVQFVSGNFTSTDLPACDAIVASYALHHIPSAPAKTRFYRRCFRALKRGGVIVSADCFPPASRTAWRNDREQWIAFLAREFGSRREARRVFESWADEDTYMRLDDEVAMMRRAGFEVDVPWRRSPFAVVVGVS